MALDTAVSDKAEEFPDFTRIYIETPGTSGASVTVHGLLEGPSIVGACRFAMTRSKGVIMDIDQALFLRKPVSRFGIAPLTSMYWFSETAKPTAVDWRPEVHDSDGLALRTGRGQRIWRPLNNPPHIVASAFSDENPKGFGLLQRDRSFDHYLDGVFYEKRPSLWVEPRGAWGRGAVQLIELPTRDEIQDNIIVAWVPETPVYMARNSISATGFIGWPTSPTRPISPAVSPPASAMEVSPASRARRVCVNLPDGVAGHWRAQFYLADVQGADPVEIRLHLTVGETIASGALGFLAFIDISFNLLHGLYAPANLFSDSGLQIEAVINVSCVVGATWSIWRLWGHPLRRAEDRPSRLLAMEAAGLDSAGS